MIRFCVAGTRSIGISTPRSPRATMMASVAATMASSRSSACCFSIFATSGSLVRTEDVQVGQVGPVLFGQRGKRRGVTRKVDPLARAEGSTDANPAGDVIGGDVGGHEIDGSVGDVDGIADVHPLVERRIADRHPARPQRQDLPFLDDQLGWQIGEPQLGAGQVDQHRDVGAMGACPANAGGLLARPGVRQVHPQEVDAGVEQSLERAGRILGRSDGGDDLGTTLVHRLPLYLDCRDLERRSFDYRA